MPVGCLLTVRKAVRLQEYALERIIVYRSRKATKMRVGFWRGMAGYGSCRWRLTVKYRAEENELKSVVPFPSSGLWRRTFGSSDDEVKDLKFRNEQKYRVGSCKNCYN